MDTTSAKQASTKFVVLGLLLGILMSAMDNTIVATAMGSIVADLGSFDKFAWVTASYMVAVMAGMRFTASFPICMAENVFSCLDLFFS